jgi:hypothetical protein
MTLMDEFYNLERDYPRDLASQIGPKKYHELSGYELTAVTAENTRNGRWLIRAAEANRNTGLLVAVGTSSYMQAFLRSKIWQFNTDDMPFLDNVHDAQEAYERCGAEGSIALGADTFATAGDQDVLQMMRDAAADGNYDLLVTGITAAQMGFRVPQQTGVRIPPVQYEDYKETARYGEMLLERLVAQGGQTT